MKKLIQGDNLAALTKLGKTLTNSIDLIYIDPPFATKNVYYSGTDRSSTISAPRNGNKAYMDTLQGEVYLDFLKQRLETAAPLLKNTGSIYVHIDCKIGYRVRVLMDEVFGSTNFRNEISRIKCNPKNFDRQSYGNIKDVILFYTKSSEYVWNDARLPLTEEDIKKRFNKINRAGERYTTIPLHAPGETLNGATGSQWRGMSPPPGRHWRSAPDELEQLHEQGLIEWSSTGNPRKIIYATDAMEAGKKMQDVWYMKDPQYPKYPTQKPMEVLRTILLASSNPDGVVLDFFCGSGTTLLAAEELGRNWIGIDASDAAIGCTKDRLGDAQYEFIQLEHGAKPQSNENR